MDLGLKDKSVVITGGASNIGRGIVLAFAGEGAHITVGDLDDGQAEKVADLARKKGAASVQVIKTDVTDLGQVEAMFKAATDRHGTVDVLVNNVGWDQFMFFTQTTPELWQKIIQINYVGMLNCTKCVLDIMIPNKAGAIVSISSDASRSRRAARGGLWRRQGRDQLVHEDHRQGERPLRHPLQCRLPRRHRAASSRRNRRRQHVE